MSQADALDVGGPSEPCALCPGRDRRMFLGGDVAPKRQLLARHSIPLNSVEPQANKPAPQGRA